MDSKSDLSSTSSPLVKIIEDVTPKTHGETWSKGSSPKITKGRANSVCSSTPFLARASLSSRQALPTPIFFQKPESTPEKAGENEQEPNQAESPLNERKKSSNSLKKKKSCPQILQIFKDVGPTKKEIKALLQSPQKKSEKLEKDSTRLFGVKLETLMKREKSKGNLLEIPHIVFFFVEYIRSNGIDACGIFRQSGHHTKQLEKEAIIESGVNLNEISYDDVDIHTMANILKNYLRSLPEPIIPRLPYFSLLAQVSAFSDENLRLACYKMIINALPPSRYELLKYLIGFLHEISNNSIKNLMGASNLALIFAPIFFGSLEDDNDGKESEFVIDPMALFKESKFISNITQQLIDYPMAVFDEYRKPPPVFRANECFKSTEEPASGNTYITLLRGDYVIIIRDLGNDESLVLAEATTGILPNSIFMTLGPIDFVNIQAKDITFLFTSKLSTKVVDKKDKLAKRGGSFSRLFSKDEKSPSSPKRKNSTIH